MEDKESRHSEGSASNQSIVSGQTVESGNQPFTRRFVSRFLRGGIERIAPNFRGFTATSLTPSKAIMMGEASTKPKDTQLEERKDFAPADEFVTLPANGEVDLKPVATILNIPKIRGFLVSYENDKAGDVIALRAGQWIVSSEPSLASKNFILINDSSISPIHAVINFSDSGEITLCDNLSENGSAIRRDETDEEKVGIKPTTLKHGDVVKFGSRSFHLCIVQ